MYKNGFSWRNFAPALFLGASLGVVSAGIGLILVDINPCLIILSSMSALGSCIIGGPIANVLIIFELTSNYQAALSAGGLYCSCNYSFISINWSIYIRPTFK